MDKCSKFQLRPLKTRKSYRTTITRKYGKKIPIKNWRIALKVDAGVIWEDPAIYGGTLRDHDFQNITAVLRPNIEF